MGMIHGVLKNNSVSIEAYKNITRVIVLRTLMLKYLVMEYKRKASVSGCIYLKMLPVVFE
jgi:hypothetical protein